MKATNLHLIQTLFNKLDNTNMKAKHIDITKFMKIHIMILVIQYGKMNITENSNIFNQKIH